MIYLIKKEEKSNKKFVGCYLSDKKYIEFIDAINMKRVALRKNYTITDAIEDAVELFIKEVKK